jgi:cytochrome c biogenesis protein CcdA
MCIVDAITSLRGIMIPKKVPVFWVPIFLLPLIISPIMLIHASYTVDAVVIGPRCDSCIRYIQELQTALEDLGVKEIEILFIDPIFVASEALEAHERRNDIHSRFNVPLEMQGRITVLLDDRILFEGKVPTDSIVDYLKNHLGEHPRLVVKWDEVGEIYQVLDETGKVIEHRDWDSIWEQEGSETSRSLNALLITVVVSGLLDGINPCAFTVLIFMIGILFATITNEKGSKLNVLLIGSVYIAAVFLAYTVIGLSLYKIVELTEFTTLIARAGAIIMIFLGLLTIKDYFFRNSFSLRIPLMGQIAIYEQMRKLTFSAVFVAGLMVGVFELPCTGGIYLGIIGLLANQSTFFEGLGYIIIYNLAFVFPLFLILALSISGKVRRFSLEKAGYRGLKLLSGLIFISLGLYILFSWLF